MTGPADVTGNYLAVMRETGQSWDDLADQFDRDAELPALDGGAGARRMARWARSNADAGRERREHQAPEQPPVDPRPEPPRRTATPPRPTRRTAKAQPRKRPGRPAGATAAGAAPPPDPPGVVVGDPTPDAAVVVTSSED
jgi:hypothetical protein